MAEQEALMHIDGEFELHDDVALLRRMPFVASVTLVPPLHTRALGSRAPHLAPSHKESLDLFFWLGPLL